MATKTKTPLSASIEFKCFGGHNKVYCLAQNFSLWVNTYCVSYLTVLILTEFQGGNLQYIQAVSDAKQQQTQTKGQHNITMSFSQKLFCISSVNQSSELFIAPGSFGSRSLMLACSGTSQSSHSLWAAAQLVHTAPGIYLDPDSLWDCRNYRGWQKKCGVSAWSNSCSLIHTTNEC